MRNPKGTRRERELLEKLKSEGYSVHRVAGSGKNTAAVCDLIAVKKGKPYFIEVKSRKKIFYTKDSLSQLKELIDDAKRCGAVPMLAVKLNYKDWQFFDLRKGIPDKVE